MAPVEVMREIKAASLRKIDEMNHAIHLAWRIKEIDIRTKKITSGKGKNQKVKHILPKLEKLLIPDEPKPKRQTGKQMEGVVRTLAARSGIPFRKVKPRGK